LANYLFFYNFEIYTDAYFIYVFLPQQEIGFSKLTQLYSASADIGVIITKVLPRRMNTDRAKGAVAIPWKTLVPSSHRHLCLSADNIASDDN
jgi:hypothetical protein